MKYIIYISVLILFIRCKDENKTILKTNAVEKQIKTLEIKTNEQKTDEIFDSQFIFKNDTLVQKLFCSVPKDGKINFKLTLENRFTLKSKSIEGIAKLLNISNGESDVDDQGYGYFVDEYEYIILSCSMVFRIDSDENKRARIKMSNCKEKDELFKDYSPEIMYLRTY